MFDSIKSKAAELVAKMPSAKTVGLTAGVAATVVAAIALGCVATAVQSDVGHELLDLF